MPTFRDFPSLFIPSQTFLDQLQSWRNWHLSVKRQKRELRKLQKQQARLKELAEAGGLAGSGAPLILSEISDSDSESDGGTKREPRPGRPPPGMQDPLGNGKWFPAEWGLDGPPKARGRPSHVSGGSDSYSSLHSYFVAFSLPRA